MYGRMLNKQVVPTVEEMTEYCHEKRPQKLFKDRPESCFYEAVYAYRDQGTHVNIKSEKGIWKRQIRSIQTEGHFGDIKENENVCCFNYRSLEKVYKELMLYVIGQNINKSYRFFRRTEDSLKKGLSRGKYRAVKHRVPRDSRVLFGVRAQYSTLAPMIL